MKGATGKITYRILADQGGLFDISELLSLLNERLGGVRKTNKIENQELGRWFS